MEQVHDNATDSPVIPRHGSPLGKMAAGAVFATFLTASFLFGMRVDLPLTAKILLTFSPELLLLAGAVGATALNRLRTRPIDPLAPAPEPEGLAAYRAELRKVQPRVTSKVLDPEVEFGPRPHEARRFSREVTGNRITVQTKDGRRIELGYNARYSRLQDLFDKTEGSDLTPRARWVLNRIQRELHLSEEEKVLVIRCVEQASAASLSVTNERFSFPMPEDLTGMQGFVEQKDLTCARIADQLPPPEVLGIRYSQTFKGLTYDAGVEKYLPDGVLTQIPAEFTISRSPRDELIVELIYHVPLVATWGDVENLQRRALAWVGGCVRYNLTKRTATLWIDPPTLKRKPTGEGEPTKLKEYRERVWGSQEITWTAPAQMRVDREDFLQPQPGWQAFCSDNHRLVRVIKTDTGERLDFYPETEEHAKELLRKHLNATDSEIAQIIHQAHQSAFFPTAKTFGAKYQYQDDEVPFSVTMSNQAHLEDFAYDVGVEEPDSSCNLDPQIWIYRKGGKLWMEARKTLPVVAKFDDGDGIERNKVLAWVQGTVLYDLTLASGVATLTPPSRSLPAEARELHSSPKGRPSATSRDG
jgi:hypothetical protein